MDTLRPTVDGDGTIRWHLNGQWYRADGPAVERPSATRERRVRGLRHRVDGPAIEWSDGGAAWYVLGVMLTEDSHAPLAQVDDTIAAARRLT